MLVGEAGLSRAHVLLGGAAFPSTADVGASPADLTINEASTSSELGSALASLDLDLDGAPELVVGAEAASPGGLVHVLPSAPGLPPVVDLDLSPAATKIIGVSGSHLGRSMSHGDFNGDTGQDLILAAPYSGHVYVFYASSPGGSVGPGGGTISIPGASLTIPPGAFSAPTSVAFRAGNAGDLGAALADTPSCASVLASFRVSVAGPEPTLPMSLDVDNIFGASSADQVLVGRVTPSGQPEGGLVLSFTGEAAVTASSVSFDITQSGTYSFIRMCPGYPLAFASGSVLESSGAPVGGAIVGSTGGAPFVTFSLASGQFRVPVGVRGATVLLLAGRPGGAASAALAAFTSAAPGIPFTAPIFDTSGLIGIQLPPSAGGGGVSASIPIDLPGAIDVIKDVILDKLDIPKPSVPVPCTDILDPPPRFSFGEFKDSTLEVGEEEQLFIDNGRAPAPRHGGPGATIYALNRKILRATFVLGYNVTDNVTDHDVAHVSLSSDSPEHPKASLFADTPGEGQVEGAIIRFHLVSCKFVDGVSWPMAFLRIMPLPALPFTVIASPPTLSSSCPSVASPGEEIAFRSNVLPGTDPGYIVFEHFHQIPGGVSPTAVMQLGVPPVPPPTSVTTWGIIAAGLPNGAVLTHTAIATIRNEAGEFVATLTSSCSTTVRAAHDPNDKRALPEARVAPGAAIDYTIRYENVGDGTAFSVFVVDSLPLGIVDSSLQIENGGVFDPTARTVTWQVGTLGPHLGGSLTFSVQVDPSASTGTLIENQAIVYFPSALEITPTNTTVQVVCDQSDADCDLRADAQDNCPSDPNGLQENIDLANSSFNRPGADLFGDVCDGDIDGDGYTNAQETALLPAKNPNIYCDIMRADVDGDHAVTILDMTVLAGRFLDQIPPAPARYKQDADNAITILDLTMMANLFLDNVAACP